MPITNIGLPTSFVPTSLTGCQLWLDGNDPAGTGTPPANGAGIATWVNKGLASTNLVLFTTNGGSNPTYAANFQNGKGAVAFNSSNAFRSSFAFNLSTRTVFIVCKQNIAEFCGIMGLSAGDHRSVDSTTGIAFQASEGAWHFSWLYNIFNPSNQILYANSSPNTGYYLYTGTSAIATPLNIYEEVFSSNYEQTFVNGTAGQTFTTTTTPGSSTQIYVGARWNHTGSGSSFNGNILEVIIYNTALNTTQRQEVEKYLAWKWGLASRLSTTHPSYKGPPVAFGKVPYYTAFSPTSLPGCSLWLDARDRSAMTFSSGNTLSTWLDKSGNNRTATAFASPVLTQNAINGYPAISAFRGPFFKGAISITGSNFTAFSVATSSGGNFGQRLLSFVNSNVATADWTSATTCIPIYIDAGSQGVLSTYRTGSGGAFAGNAYSAGVPFMAATQYTGTNGFMWFNGSNATTTGGASTGNFGVNLYGVGCQPLDLGEYWNGYIGEVIVYNTTLTTNERQQVEGYLSQKWSLTPSLPVGHLNKTRPIGLPAAVAAPLSLFTFISKFMSTYYNLSGAYALSNISNSVTSLSATPAYVWTVSVPSAAKGKNGILAVFFNLYSTTQFTSSQYFDYGVYVDGVAQMLGDATGTLRYVQTAGGNYAMSSSGISLGTNGLVNGFPLIVPLSFLASASQIQIGFKNSSSPFSPVSSSVPGYNSNVLTSTGTSNTNNFVPQNTFTISGSYTVPSTCSAGTVTGVFIYLWGGGGGAASNAGLYYPGGSGGYVTGFYSCAAGTILSYVVNQGAGQGTGNGSAQHGGGFSAVYLSGSQIASNLIGLAGGGGGGDTIGQAGVNSYSTGGYGGYPSGGAPYVIATGLYSVLQTGGTQVSGGVGGNQAGSQFLGGTGLGGGGGGGGWYGGGGGYFNKANDAGGGGSGYIGNVNGASGGLGFTSSAAYANGTTYLGNIATPQSNLPGGTNSPYYVTGYGHGNGGAGYVVIIPSVGTAATQIGVSAALYSG